MLHPTVQNVTKFSVSVSQDVKPNCLLTFKGQVLFAAETQTVQRGLQFTQALAISASTFISLLKKHSTVNFIQELMLGFDNLPIRVGTRV